MSKNDFSKVNTDPVINVISEATDDRPHKGRKNEGKKQTSLTLSEDVREYIRIMSGITTGGNYSLFVNNVLQDHLRENKKVYEAAKNLAEKMNN